MARSLSKPTKSMKSAAWRKLHEMAQSDHVSDTAKVAALRAIALKGDPGGVAAEREADRLANSPRVIIALPNNHRDPNFGNGIRASGNVFLVIHDTPEQLAAFRAQIASDGGKATATKVKPAPKTNAERQAAWRQRRKVAA